MSPEPYAPAALKLLQSSLESSDEETWRLLLFYRQPICEYFTRIGLLVCIYEDDGFAYLDQPPLEDEHGQPLPLPRLQRQDRLNWYESLLGALLRQKLYQHEVHDLENRKLILTKTQLRNLLLHYIPYEQQNAAKTIHRIDAAIARLSKLGFLNNIMNHRTPTHHYEVRRILKAHFTPDVLATLLDELKKKGIHHEQTDSHNGADADEE